MKNLVSLILISALLWTDLAWAGEVAALSPSSRFGGIEGLYRPVDFKYFRAIRDECFKGIESPFVLVPASGSDISSVLLLTDATYAICIDLLPFGEHRASVTREAVEAYFGYKRSDTWVPGGLLREYGGNLRTFIELELDRIGVTDYRITQDSEYKDVYHLYFEWAYPGENTKKRRFTFVGRTDVVDTGRWSRWVPMTKFDGVILKAGEYKDRYSGTPPFTGIESPRHFLKEILFYMNFDSYIITDAVLFGLSGIIREEATFVKELNPVTRPHLTALEERGAQFGYAEQAVNIYQVKVRRVSDAFIDSATQVEANL